MTIARQLIVNADDFGQSPGVNQGIIEAHERGIVTSASLMVRWPNAPEAAAYSRVHPDLSLGLHLDLGEWAFRNETWVPLYEVTALDEGVAVADEVSRQLTAFRRLVGKYPTHIDSHQHVHLREPVRSVAIGSAQKLTVPLRHCSPEVNYCGDFYGQTSEGLSLPGSISAAGLIRIIAALPCGLTELSCHPSVANDLDTMYGSERVEELKVLCDPQVRAAVADMRIELRSFLEPGASTEPVH
jgi:predicted glycoside hydrolase/deacetylase ChbG (UPF0249 family)